MGPPSKHASSAEIRQVFAEGCYFSRFQEGEFEFEVRDLGPALTRCREQLPKGMRAQMVTYRLRSGRTVAHVHQRAGDEFGNPAPDTWADPKYVFHKGVRYHHDPRLDPPEDWFTCR